MTAWCRNELQGKVMHSYTPLHEVQIPAVSLKEIQKESSLYKETPCTLYFLQ